MLTSYSASTSYFLLQCPRECCKPREHTGRWMLPMPRDFRHQPLSIPQCSPRIPHFVLPRLLPFPQPPSLSPLTLAGAWQKHTTSLAVTGSSPSCCCRQRYLLSGGQYAVQHKQGPHQALRSAESRNFRWFLAYSWMCVPHVLILFRYFCLPLWIVGDFSVSLSLLCVVEAVGFTSTRLLGI